MKCTQRDNDSGTTCPRLCKNLDGSRCAWTDEKCSCSICRCFCQKRYAISDVAAIGIELNRREAIKNNPEFAQMTAPLEAKTWIAETMAKHAERR